MDKEKIIKTGYDLLYLSSCALTDKKPNIELVEKADFSMLKYMSNIHRINVMLYIAVKNAYDVNLPDNKFVAWLKSRYDKNYQKMIRFEIERNEIYRFLSKKGIWHSSLKGIIMHKYYPKADMRQMSDNDILYDSDYQKIVMDYFTERGYRYIPHENVLGDKDDCFEKEPFYHFEMHRYLVEKEWYPKEYEYYKNIKKKLIKDDNDEFLYHFSDEDFYIFMVVHAAKHRNGNISMLRSLFDFYVFLSKKVSTLNWKYIFCELNSLDLSEYESVIRSLSKKVETDFCNYNFSNLTKVETKELYDMFYTGTLCAEDVITRKQIINACDNVQVTGKGKFIFVINRLFPSYKFMHENYKIAKYRWLLPIAYLYRIGKNIIVHRSYLKSQIISIFRL